ncbi:MAG: N-acyl homoserine lactonase family protein, partial [Pseudonocardia sp.]
KLVCHQREKDFATGFEGLFNGAHLKTDYEGLELQTVSGDTEFLPGITLIETPGHTVGTMSMQVDLPDSGTMIFTSDAVYMGESFGPPATPAAIVNNLEDFYRSVEKLRGIQERTNAAMVFGHDAEQIHKLRVAPGGSYT